jgi:hypothetical protein
MLSAKLKEAAGNSADATLYVNDVFSTWLYTGNGSTQTITNGIDLDGEGGLVWCKSRMPFDTSGNVTNHVLMDSVTNGRLRSNTTGALLAGQNITRLSSGFTVIGTELNSTTSDGTPPNNYASWTFREAPKFFDIVTYTGTGSARTIAHNLGIAPGMVIVKRTDTSSNWQVYHKNLTSAEYSIQLNLTAVQASAPTVWNSTAPTSSVFSVGTDATVNASGGTYVAYLYAHDTSSTGIIQCGSFATDGSGNATVNLGWEPQYVMVKITSSPGGSWDIQDSMRGFTSSPTVYTANPILKANEASAENTIGANTLQLNSTGFTTDNTTYNPSKTYIYMAIRMPNKPPTSGTQVYNGITRTGTGAAGVKVTGAGFTPDMSMISLRAGSTGEHGFIGDRLRGTNVENYLHTSATSPEVGDVPGFIALLSLDMDGQSLANTNVYGTREYYNAASFTYIDWFFKRAPGFFDEVCYTGTGANTTQAHNLGVVPELMIVKSRSAAGNQWAVYSAPTGNGNVLYLNLTNASASNAFVWNNTTPTASNFTISIAGAVNTADATYVAYLFATLAGISKVGSYTGNGSSQNIECGFAAGARFFLVKATSTTGSWWVWDSARGITAGNDPALQLNSTAAEITTADAVDPYAAGITVNQEATCSINASGVSYIYLAIS